MILAVLSAATMLGFAVITGFAGTFIARRRSSLELPGGPPCAVLHRTAALEVALFGEVLSGSVKDHVAECKRAATVVEKRKESLGILPAYTEPVPVPPVVTEQLAAEIRALTRDCVELKELIDRPSVTEENRKALRRVLVTKLDELDRLVYGSAVEVRS